MGLLELPALHEELRATISGYERLVEQLRVDIETISSTHNQIGAEREQFRALRADYDELGRRAARLDASSRRWEKAARVLQAECDELGRRIEVDRAIARKANLRPRA